MNKLIGLFGGTFDPIHNGHLAIAELLLKRLPFHEIRFIPCRNPVFKKMSHASDVHRVAMLKLALNHHEKFILDTQEINRNEPSYTILTLKSMRKLFPNDSLCLIIGYDAFSELTRWYEWQSLISICHMIVVNRPGCLQDLSPDMQTYLQKYETKNKKKLQETTHGTIYQIHSNHNPLSSSLIRDTIESGQNVKNYLPPSVWDYIQKHKLYQRP